MFAQEANMHENKFNTYINYLEKTFSLLACLLFEIENSIFIFNFLLHIKNNPLIIIVEKAWFDHIFVIIDTVKQRIIFIKGIDS